MTNKLIRCQAAGGDHQSLHDHLLNGEANALLFVLSVGLVSIFLLGIYFVVSVRKKEALAKAAGEKLEVQIQEKERLNRQMQEYTDKLELSRMELEATLQTLEDEKSRVTAIVDNVLEGIIITDKRGKITRINSFAEEMFGYQPNELIDQDSDILIPEKFHSWKRSQVADDENLKPLQDGIRYEIEGLRKDGTVFPMTLIRTRIQIDNETMFIGLARDITSEKAKEKVNKRLIKQIIQEKEVAEKFAQQARDEKERAEAANVAKSDFLANMSHEIRTPMNGIIGMAALLYDTKLNSEQHNWVDIIRRSGENLMQIINDILDFSKIEAGKLILEPREFDLHNIIRDVTDVLNFQAEENAIELIVDFGDNIPKMVVGDAGRVRQIVFNLVGNAIKFTPKGHVLIRIRNIQEENRAHLFFAIEDTGIGIPADKLSYVFSKFSQAEESTTRKFGGTGLGLTICKNLVEMMGGKIGVESEEGKGSTFHYDLFLGMGEETDDPMERIPDYDLTGEKVLVVDTQAVSREITGRYLEFWKTDVTVVASEDEGINCLETADEEGRAFSLLILDASVGGEDDLSYIQKYVKAQRSNALQVILLGRSGFMPSPADLRENSVGGLLTKPFQPDTLMAMVKILLDIKQKGLVSPLVTRHMISSMVNETKEVETKKAQYEFARILVVEDIKMNVLLIKKILTNHGCRVDVAINGREAVTMREKTDYNLIFMDCQMPVLDGFEATGEIRDYEKKNRVAPVKIIALTADAMTGDREKCLNAGMDDYMNKPINANGIADCLKFYLTPEAVH
ncbi:MAG: ATP-binding protein [Sneathiellales bacterium]|nr:ATP-binding protein [Sneathiellales bacterium]